MRRTLIATLFVGCTADAPVPLDLADVDIVSAFELEAALGAVQVLDARNLGGFDQGHVPGALSVPSAELRATVDGVSGQALARDEAVAMFEDAGVDPSQPIVVTGDGNDTTAARLVWSLAYYGAADAVAMLDGGIAAYADAGFDLETDAEVLSNTDWSATDANAGVLVDKQWVLDHLDDADVVLFDVRSDSEYTDGHIPGAINVDWTLNLASDGTFLPTDEVLALHGNPTAPTVVVYCQSGSRASVSWTVLAAAGLNDVRLYDGSFGEWGADESLPVNQGQEP